jgi:glycosyltransferase involved in cell wall biosynthesis
MSAWFRAAHSAWNRLVRARHRLGAPRRTDGPLRIAYLHQYYTTLREAGGTRSYEFALRMAQRGHAVDMITTDYRALSRGTRKSGRWRVSVEQGVRVHRLKLPYAQSMGYARRVWVFISFARSATTRLFAVKPDVIFATSTPLTIAIPALVYRLVRPVPMVFEVRDAWPELPIALGVLKNRFLQLLALLLERVTYLNSSAVVALSPGMKDSVARTGYPRERIFVIPNACDLVDVSASRKDGAAWLARHEWAKDRRLIVYLGAIGRTHGVGSIVDLAAAVRSIGPHLCFVIIGDGAELDLVTERARQLGVLGDNLHILPEIPKSQVAGVLSVATAAISTMAPVPELEANSANKFFDYLASAKPIVINYGGWQQALLEQSGAGIRIDNQDPERAAKELVEFLGDSEALERASSASALLARTQFSRDDLAEKLSSILEDSVTQPPGRR